MPWEEKHPYYSNVEARRSLPLIFFRYLLSSPSRVGSLFYFVEVGRSIFVEKVVYVCRESVLY